MTSFFLDHRIRAKAYLSSHHTSCTVFRFFHSSFIIGSSTFLAVGRVGNWRKHTRKRRGGKIILYPSIVRYLCFHIVFSIITMRVRERVVLRIINNLKKKSQHFDNWCTCFAADSLRHGEYSSDFHFWNITWNVLWFGNVFPGLGFVENYEHFFQQPAVHTPLQTRFWMKLAAILADLAGWDLDYEERRWSDVALLWLGSQYGELNLFQCITRTR